MSERTIGNLNGFVSHEDILNYIKKKYDPMATVNVDKTIVANLSDFKEEYQINPHSETDQYYYIVDGYISFNYRNLNRTLMYSYKNINWTEKLEYYKSLGLEDFVRAEKTYIDLIFDNDSVKIITNILHNFTGGWINEKENDDKSYYFVDRNPCQIGGIYKERYTSKYFVVCDISHSAKLVYGYTVVTNPLKNTTISNQYIRDMLHEQIDGNSFYRDNYWMADFETVKNILDGYLGKIADIQLQTLVDCGM